MIGAAIAGGIASLGSSIVNSLTARKNTDKQNKANRELAEYSYAKDTEAWNRQNEYNKPESQMARLKAAGLNPNLIYGSGGATTTAAEMPKYHAPTQEYNYRPAVDPVQMLGAYQDFRIKQAQAMSLEAEAQFKGRGLQDRLDWLSNNKNIAGQVVDKNATELGWMNAPIGESPKNKYGQFRDYQSTATDAGARQKEEGILNMIKQRGKLDLDTQYRQKELDNFLTKMWSQLIYGGMGAVSKFRGK